MIVSAAIGRAGALAFDGAQDQVSRAIADVIAVNAHRRDRRIAAAGNLEIAEARDGDALGNLPLRRLHSITAPKAERSDTQIAASTSGHCSISRTTASPPCFMEMGGVPKEMTRDCLQAQLRHRGFIARPAVGAARIAVGGAADEGDAAVALAMQVTHQRLRCLGIGEAHHMAHRRLRQVPCLDHRECRNSPAACAPAAYGCRR